ncbi:unnamed protein product, partial [Ectocarpus sp. 12 AP-2014]
PEAADPSVHGLPRVFAADGVGEGRHFPRRRKRGVPDDAAEPAVHLPQLGRVYGDVRRHGRGTRGVGPGRGEGPHPWGGGGEQRWGGR